MIGLWDWLKLRVSLARAVERVEGELRRLALRGVRRESKSALPSREAERLNTVCLYAQLDVLCAHDSYLCEKVDGRRKRLRRRRRR